MRTTKEQKKAIGERLQGFMDAAGLSQADLRREISIDQGQISKIVSGAEAPSPEKAAELEDALGLDGGQLLDGLTIPD